MDLFNKNIFDNRRIKPLDLEIGKSYPLEKLERVNTEFGGGIVAKLKLENESVILYLPGHYMTKLTNTAIEEINSQQDLCLVYDGPTPNSFKYKLIKNRNS